jgi:hypothetical protein
MLIIHRRWKNLLGDCEKDGKGKPSRAGNKKAMPATHQTPSSRPDNRLSLLLYTTFFRLSVRGYDAVVCLWSGHQGPQDIKLHRLCRHAADIGPDSRPKVQRQAGGSPRLLHHSLTTSPTLIQIFRLASPRCCVSTLLCR